MKNQGPILVTGATGSIGSAMMWNDLLRGREAFVTPSVMDMSYIKATISAEKIHLVLGWTPTISQEEAFCLTEQWLRQEVWLI